MTLKPEMLYKVKIYKRYYYDPLDDSENKIESKILLANNPTIKDKENTNYIYYIYYFAKKSSLLKNGDIILILDVDVAISKSIRQKMCSALYGKHVIAFEIKENEEEYFEEI